MTFPHIRAPWLRTFADRLTRRESAHPLKDAWERMQARMEGLDLELPLPLPHYSDLFVVSNDNWESER